MVRRGGARVSKIGLGRVFYGLVGFGEAGYGGVWSGSARQGILK